MEEEKDKMGYVIRKVIRRLIYVTTLRSMIRKLEVMPDGQEKELEMSVEESGETKEGPPPVISRVVRRMVQEPSGKEKVVEEPEFVTPLEVSITEESEPETEVKWERGTVIRTVWRRCLVTTVRRVVRRVVERPDGRQEGPIEDQMEEPIESEYVKPGESIPEVQEVKDRKGVVLRRVVRRLVPVVTTSKVYRTIVLAPDGEEESVEEKVKELDQPQEEVVVPMEYAETEALPDEPTTRREKIFRTPVPKEDVPQEPTPEETVKLEDGQIIRRTVNVGKRTIRKIIILPDETRKEVEEEVPEEDPEQAPEDVKEVIQTRTVRWQEPEELTRRQVYKTVTTAEVTVKPDEKEQKKPERMFVRRLVTIHHRTEMLVDEPETITRGEAVPKTQEPEQVSNTCILF